jgi:hypothetical protein
MTLHRKKLLTFVVVSLVTIIVAIITLADTDKASADTDTGGYYNCNSTRSVHVAIGSDGKTYLRIYIGGGGIMNDRFARYTNTVYYVRRYNSGHATISGWYASAPVIGERDSYSYCSPRP